MARSGPEVADVFRRYGDAYREQHGGSLSTAQRRAMTAIETLPDGGARWPRRAVRQLRSSAHLLQQLSKRHCPKCQSLARAQWLDDRRAEILDTQYFHVVFTLPEEIGAIALQNKAVVYDILFRTAAETLRTIAADPKHLGAEIGFFAVLHTWGSESSASPSPALRRARRRTVTGRRPGGSLAGPDFSCRSQVLSCLFRRLFIEALQKAIAAGQLQFFSALAHLREQGAFQRYLAPLRQTDWVVYAKPSLRRTGAGPRLCRPLHASRRHFQQPHPRHRRWQGPLPLEGLSSRQPAEDDDSRAPTSSSAAFSFMSYPAAFSGSAITASSAIATVRRSSPGVANSSPCQRPPSGGPRRAGTDATIAIGSNG